MKTKTSKRIEVTGPQGRIMIEEKDLRKYQASGHTQVPVVQETYPTPVEDVDILEEISSGD